VDTENDDIVKGNKVEYFNLCHERFDRMKEFSGGRMRNLLQVKPSFKDREEFVELRRFDHRPWNDVQLAAVQLRDEVAISLLVDDRLKFLRKPTSHTLTWGSSLRFRKALLAGDDVFF
jgi:hypothetical protein